MMSESNVNVNVNVNASETLFPGISSEENEAPTEIESLCTNCEENGITKILLRTIPNFGKIVIMSFHCMHCDFQNNEIQPADSIQEKGVIFTLRVPENDQETLSRQIIKSDSAIFKIPELEFEIPPNTQKGVLSTIEGILKRAIENLQEMQEVRKRMDPESYEKINKFCERLNNCANGHQSFTVTLDDPSGNSYIEYHPDPLSDNYLKKDLYIRTKEQIKALGLLTTENDEYHARDAKGIQVDEGIIRDITNDHFINVNDIPEEIMTFPGTCLACHEAIETRMFPMIIPHFKEVIIMSNTCDHCGYKNSEVRPGGGISEQGCIITLKIENLNDLKRDIIKSHSCSLNIPEIDVLVGAGTSFITTIEGIPIRIKDELSKMFCFDLGDSAAAAAVSIDSENSKTLELEYIFNKLMLFKDAKESWTLILKDPLSNSFIAPLCSNIEDDTKLKYENYERSYEEDELYGINQLKKHFD